MKKFTNVSFALQKEHVYVNDKRLIFTSIEETTAATLNLARAKAVNPRNGFYGTGYVDLSSNLVVLVHSSGYWCVIPFEDVEPKVKPKPSRPDYLKGRILPGQKFTYPVYVLHISGQIRAHYSNRSSPVENYIKHGAVYDSEQAAEEAKQLRLEYFANAGTQFD